MKKEKNKGKKLLAAVGAVVAAGLAPGFIAATPHCVPSQDPNVEITAAQVVAIAGSTYSFDELFAIQERVNGPRQEQPQHATRYGMPRPRPHQPHVIVQVPAYLDTIQMDLIECCIQLADEDPYTQGVVFDLDSDLTREIGLDDYQLKELKAFIEDYYGVEVSYHRFRLNGQLNTLRLISEYIYKLKTVWD